MATLTTKALLLARLPRTEGRRLKPYRDTVGVWTVGVGHNISAKGLPSRMVVAIIETGQLTDQMVDELLSNDVDEALKSATAIPVFNTLDPFRQSVLGDMVFNIGLGSVLGFTNTLMYLQRGDWANAASMMLKSKWAEQVGNRAIELAGIIRDGQIKSPQGVV